MTPSPMVTTPHHDAVIRRAIASALGAFLASKTRATEHSRLPVEPGQVLRDFLAGGKLIRPLLCVRGWQAGGGRGMPGPVLDTAASLELFHAFALIHDDIIDASDTRRGRPTVHREIGTDAAILLGDLALVWSGELLQTAGLTPDQLHAALPVIHALREDTIHGQYLDIAQNHRPTDDLDVARAIIRYKTTKYTVEGPLLVGAALAGADAECRRALIAFSAPLGEAFQLRDDLLGVFGDPRDTGKPNLDDLREGKATVLMALALRNADAAQRQTLRRHVGNARLREEEAAQVRAVLTATGARHRTEERIKQCRSEALAALRAAPLPRHTLTALRSLTFDATVRNT
ncbi:polyprenyl synthetase family protein [Streptomyces sp. NPDC093595]|uniref:polyprenyl synthetase family protein n=1 Tax=Streptomyces sp. NPDC093595 TaxID=3366045 RepID=UPI00380106FA